MTDKLNPDALAEMEEEAGASPEDVRPGVQPVTWEMIYDHVTEELPNERSRKAFAEWLDETWFEFNEDGDCTNGQVVAGALADWRGQ